MPFYSKPPPDPKPTLAARSAFHQRNPCPQHLPGKARRQFVPQEQPKNVGLARPVTPMFEVLNTPVVADDELGTGEKLSREEVTAVNSLLQAIYELREKGRALQRHCVVAEAACLERMQEKLMEEERGLRAVLKGRVTASYSAVHDALRALASEVSAEIGQALRGEQAAMEIQRAFDKAVTAKRIEVCTARAEAQVRTKAAALLSAAERRLEEPGAASVRDAWSTARFVRDRLASKGGRIAALTARARGVEAKAERQGQMRAIGSLAGGAVLSTGASAFQSAPFDALYTQAVDDLETEARSELAAHGYTGVTLVRVQRKLPPVAPCVLDQLAGSTLQAGPTAGLQDLEDAAAAAKDLGDTLAQVAERYQPPPRQPAKLPLKPEGVERILLGYSE